MAPYHNDLTDIMTISMNLEKPMNNNYQSKEKMTVHRTEIGYRATQFLAAFVVTLSAFSSGTFLAWTTSAVPLLAIRKVEMSEASWIAALLNLGAVFGAIPTGMVAERFGRKMTLLSLALPMTVSWLMMIFSTSVYCFYVGRFVGGFAIGAISVAVPPYVAELAQTKFRKQLGNFYQVQFSAGIFFGFVAGLAENIMVLSLFCATIPIVYFVAFLFMPESPVYLMSQGKVNEARNTLLYLRSAGCNIEEELSRIRNYIQSCIANESGLKQMFTEKSNFKALLIALYLMIFQQLTGICPIIFYLRSILTSFEVQFPHKYAVLLIGFHQLLAAIVFMNFFKKIGRRATLIYGNIMMFLAITILGVYFHPGIVAEKSDWMPIVCLSLFISTYSMSVGPASWLMVKEIFPSTLRRKVVYNCIGLSWFVAFLVTIFYQSKVEALGMGWVLCNFGVVCAISALIAYFLVPETKGKTLEQIQKELNGHVSLRIKYVIEIDNNPNVICHV